MGLGTFDHARPGQRLRIQADAWNAMLDAARQFRETPSGGLKLGDARGGERDFSTVLVKNDTGGAIARLSVLQITGFLIAPTDNALEFKSRAALVGDVPATGGEGQFVVVLEPLADGEIGLAVGCGIVPVQLDVIDAGHKYADIKDSYTDELESGAVGAAQILWKESGTGTKWAVVRLGAYGPSASAGTGFQVGMVLHDSEMPAQIGATEEYGYTVNGHIWRLCNGAAISRSTYSALYTKIGITFGNGDGSTTFNIPKLTTEGAETDAIKGRIIMGASPADGYSVGASGGAQLVTPVLNLVPEVTGITIDTGYASIYLNNDMSLPYPTPETTAGYVGFEDTGHTHEITDPGHSHAGSDIDPINILPPYLPLAALMLCATP